MWLKNPSGASGIKFKENKRMHKTHNTQIARVQHVIIMMLGRGKDTLSELTKMQKGYTVHSPHMALASRTF